MSLFNFKKMTYILDTFARQYEGIWYVEDDTLFFIKPTYPDSGVSYTSGELIGKPEKLKSPEELYNAILIIGGKDADGNPILAYREVADVKIRRTYYLNDETFSTWEDALAFAAYFLATYSAMEVGLKYTGLLKLLGLQEKVTVEGASYVVKGITLEQSHKAQKATLILLPYEKREFLAPALMVEVGGTAAMIEAMKVRLLGAQTIPQVDVPTVQKILTFPESYARDPPVATVVNAPAYYTYTFQAGTNPATFQNGTNPGKFNGKLIEVTEEW